MRHISDVLSRSAYVCVAMKHDATAIAATTVVGAEHAALNPRPNQLNHGFQETQMSSWNAPLAVIDKLQFGLMNPEHLRRMASVKVTRSTLKQKGFPARNSVNATPLGPQDRNHTCVICHQSVCKCDGAARTGIMELAGACYHSWHLSRIAKVANLMCPGGHLAIDKTSPKFRRLRTKCHDSKSLVDRLLTATKRITRCDCSKHVPFLKEQVDRAAAAAALSSTEVIVDPDTIPDAIKRCNNLQFEYQWDGLVLKRRVKAPKKKDLKYFTEETLAEIPKLIEWKETSPTQIRAMFARLSDEDIRLIGMDPEFSRPEWMILTVLPVSDLDMRPVIAYSNGGKTQSEDPFTRHLQGISKVNEEAWGVIWDILTVMTHSSQVAAAPVPAPSSSSDERGSITQSVTVTFSDKVDELYPDVVDATDVEVPATPSTKKKGNKRKAPSTLTAMISAQKEREKGELAKKQNQLQLIWNEKGEVSIAPSLHVDEIDIRSIDASSFDPWLHPDTRDIQEDLQYKVALYYKENVKAKVPKRHRARSQNKTKTSQQQRLIKKKGLVRGLMLAKRVDFSSRGVLAPDPNIRVNEVGLPLFICKEMTVEEVADETNFCELQRAILNGPEVHPGARAVIMEDGEMIDLRYVNRYTFELRHGMKVERHIREGDIVIFNRQPSLHKPSMMAHYVRVISGLCVRLNLSAMNPYNADCDGDTIIIHVPQKATTRTECRKIMNADEQLLTAQSNKPVMGMIQDAVWGWSQATQRDVLITEEDFYRYASYGQLVDWRERLAPPTVFVRSAALLKGWDDGCPDYETYHVLRSGKQLFSTLLPADFHLTKEYEFQFDTTQQAYLRASGNNAVPDWPSLNDRIALAEVWLRDMDFAIVGHQLLRGKVNGTMSGKAAGSITHFLGLEHEPEAGQAFLSGGQRIINPLNADLGLSTGINDLMLKQRTQLQTKMNRMLYSITNFKPLDKVVHRHSPETVQTLAEKEYDEKCEQKLCVALNDVTTHIGQDAIEAAGSRNRLVQMITEKAKGDPFNFTQMVVGLGQQIVFGGRVALDERITSHHPNRPQHYQPPTIEEEDEAMEEEPKAEYLEATYEADALIARGFVDRSFARGLTPYQFYCHSMGGREGLLNTSEKTKETGYCQRRLGKAMENNKVETDLSVRNGSGQIVERIYGRHGMNPTFMQRVPLPQLRWSDAQVCEKLGITRDTEWDELIAREKIFATAGFGITDPDVLRQVCSAEMQLLNQLKRQVLRHKLHFSGDSLQADLYVPINADRVLFKAAYRQMQMRHERRYGGADATTSNDTPLSAGMLVRCVRAFVERLYSYYPVSFNRNWELELLLQTKFSVRNILFAWELSFETLQLALIDMEKTFQRTLAQPGDMVGAESSQALSATFTQNALDFFKHAGVAIEDGSSDNSVEVIIDLKNDPTSGSTRISLLPFERVKSFLPSRVIETIVARAEENRQRDLIAYSVAVANATSSSEVPARRMPKEVASVETYCEKELYSIFSREIALHVLSELVDESPFIPEDDESWMKTSLRLLTPSDRVRVEERSDCVLRLVLDANKCRQLNVTREHLQGCIHTYLQEDAIYDWSSPSDETQYTVDSDLRHSSALPSSEATLLAQLRQQYLARTSDVKPPFLLKPPAGVQKENSTFAIVIASPDLISDDAARVFATKARAAVAKRTTNETKKVEHMVDALRMCESNWVFRVYISKDSKYYKQFAKNPQVEESGTQEITKLLTADLCQNVRVHGMKGVLRASVMTETRDVLDEVTGCVKQQQGHYINTKGSNILEILSHPLVDTYRTTTNHLHEAVNVWGIKTGATLLARILKKKLKSIGTYVDHTHILQLVETMTHRGQFMKIRRFDMNRVKTSGAIQRLSFEQPIEVITEESYAGTVDPLIGVSENVMVGKNGPMGTAMADVRLHDQEPDEHVRKQHILHLHEKVIHGLTEQDIEVLLFNSGKEHIFHHRSKERGMNEDTVVKVTEPVSADVACGDFEEEWMQRVRDELGKLERDHASRNSSVPIENLKQRLLMGQQEYATLKCAQDHELAQLGLLPRTAKPTRVGGQSVTESKAKPRLKRVRKAKTESDTTKQTASGVDTVVDASSSHRPAKRARRAKSTSVESTVPTNVVQSSEESVPVAGIRMIDSIDDDGIAQEEIVVPKSKPQAGGRKRARDTRDAKGTCEPGAKKAKATQSDALSMMNQVDTIESRPDPTTHACVYGGGANATTLFEYTCSGSVTGRELLKPAAYLQQLRRGHEPSKMRTASHLVLSQCAQTSMCTEDLRNSHVCAYFWSLFARNGATSMASDCSVVPSEPIMPVRFAI